LEATCSQNLLTDRRRSWILTVVFRHCQANQSLADGSCLGKDGEMKKLPNPYHDHRCPAELISHAVWLYHVFSLGFRDVELLLAERGVIVSYESVRQWCLKFGTSFAATLRRRRPRPGDKWHLDEVFIRIQGVQYYLWRAVDHQGVVLDILVQSRRDGGAAKRFFKRLLKDLQYVLRVLVTDKLGSYGVAKRELLPNVEHRESHYLNNTAENSHRPTRRRERQIQRFKSPQHLFEGGHGHYMLSKIPNLR
jgi:putative transposase